MTIHHLNLCQVWFCFENIIMEKSQALGEEDELARVTCARMTSVNLLDHYYWRGFSFIGFCLYEYAKLVNIKSMTLKITRDIQFLFKHFNYENQIQSYSEKSAVHTYTVTLNESLSENQSLENSVRGGHSETKSMQNNLTLILLTLLMSWNQLHSLFTMFDYADQTYKEHCAEI